jgi:Flp pilus assembly secretin CpaC
VIKRTSGFFAALALGSAIVLSQPASSQAADVPVYSLETGHSMTIDAPGLTRVAVGDSRIANAVPIGSSQIVVNAKSSGHTTLLIWSGGSVHEYEITVVSAGLQDFIKILRTTINNSSIEVFSSGVNIIVRGTVETPEDYDRVEEAIGHFTESKDAAGDTFPGYLTAFAQNETIKDKYPIIILVKIRHRLGALEADLAKIPGGETVHTETDSAGDLIVTGHVHDEIQATHIISELQGSRLTFLGTGGKVIDRIITDTHTQVNIKVYVLEVDQSAQDQLGLRLQAAVPNDPVIPTAYALGTPTFTATSAISGATAGQLAFTSLLAPTLDLLVQRGHARILSSPDLTTAPGHLATFLVGGQFPYPLSEGNGQVSIVFQQYGVQLNVNPTLLGDGSIESAITPQVSQLDYANGIQINGFTVPGITTSQLTTDVITKSGESIVMGGLLSRVTQKTVTKIPLLSDIPILGKLFQSTNYLNQKSDVVFIMTPEIITR